MSINLDGGKRELFNKALAEAFDQPELDMMLRLKLDKKLGNLVALPAEWDYVVFKVIEKAEMGSWQDKLLAAAREANPTNQKLLAFSQQFGLASIDQPRLEVQRILTQTTSFLDVETWREKLGGIEPKVCRIEIESNNGLINGTGFLVGPSMLLTNYHVIAPVIKGESGQATTEGHQALSTDVVFRFDYKRSGDGTVLNKGVSYKLAENNWLVDQSPNHYPLDETPPPDNLDYALLRLAGTPGRDAVGGGQAVSDKARRGWLELPQNQYQFVENSPLFILQHPKGFPLKLALGEQSVIGLNANATRLRHRTNTNEGSSGSPCFSQNWDLVALHHSGDPDFDPAHKPSYNQAIPIASIVDLMKQRGVFARLGEEDL